MHRAIGLGMASNVTGYFNSKYNAIEDFIYMNEENKRVHKMNDSLMNLLKQNFVARDTGTFTLKDTNYTDTTGKMRYYKWRSAQVVYATVNNEKNYLQINRGSDDGIADDMGVLNSNGGLVGKVINTGKKYSEVMLLLNVLNKLSVRMKRTGSAGMLSWDGKNAQELIMNGVPVSDSVRKGDSVLTGNFSLSFPPGKMVGTVEAVLREKATNFLILKIKPTTNFGTLQQVFVVENLMMNEQKQLDEETKKKTDVSQQRKK
jgi:rod shape-determining protein MreC